MQFVDFYFEEYRPQPLSFDSRFGMAFLAVVMVGLIAIGVIQDQKTADLKKRLAEKQQKSATLLQDVISLQKNLAKKQNIQDLDGQLVAKQQQLAQFQKAMTSLNLPSNEQTQPFGAILEALSKKQVSSIWLTEIEINHQLLSLTGIANQDVSIADYVEELKTHQALNRSFDALKIKRNETNSSLVSFELVNGRSVITKDVQP